MLLEQEIIHSPQPTKPDSPQPSVLQIGNEWLTVRAGGLNRYAWGLAQSLKHLDVPQQWIVMGQEDLASEEKINLRAVALPTASLRTRHAAIRQEFARHQFHLSASHFALYAFPVRRELRKIPHVVHFHGPWASESAVEGSKRITTWAKQYVERAVYATGDRFITLSQAFAKVLTTQYRVAEEMVRVIPGGIDFDSFNDTASRHEARQQLNWPTDRPIIFCLRRLKKRMGIEELIVAAGELKKRNSEFLLLIGGQGTLSTELESRIGEFNLQNNVQLIGAIAEADLPLAYRAADFTIVPSQSLEGFGLITLESLAAGTPVLVTPVGGLPEVVAPLSRDLVISSSDASDIGDAMHAAIVGQSSLPGSDECQEYVRTNFDWSFIAPRVLQVYKEAIAAKC